MSDKRRPDIILPLLNGKTNILKLELFGEYQFNRPDTGLFRVRIDNKWINRNGQQYTFMSAKEAVKTCLWPEVAKYLDIKVPPLPVSPLIPKGTPVIITEEEDLPSWAETTPMRAKTYSEPFQTDGEWYVYIYRTPVRLRNLRYAEET